MKRKYTPSGSPRKEREKRRHHDNVTPKRREEGSYQFVNGFVFSDNISDWMSRRAGKRQYQNLF